jgi:hypothetical protein
LRFENLGGTKLIGPGLMAKKIYSMNNNIILNLLDACMHDIMAFTMSSTFFNIPPFIGISGNIFIHDDDFKFLLGGSHTYG